MIQIDLKSRVPIYEQLVEGIKEFIIKGILTEDEKLPSVRNLSVELGINPNTIQKAYRELERMEYIYSVKGKGSYVMKREKGLRKEEKEKIENEIKKILEHAVYSGFTKDELKTILNKVTEGKE